MWEKVCKTRFAFVYGPPGIRYSIPKEATVEEATRKRMLQGHALYLPIYLFFFHSHLNCIFFVPTVSFFFLPHFHSLVLISPFKSHSRIIIHFKTLNVLQIWRFSSVIDVCEKQMICRWSNWCKTSPMKRGTVCKSIVCKKWKHFVKLKYFWTKFNCLLAKYILGFV